MTASMTFAAVINSYLPEPHASLLNGIIFGVPLRTDPYFYQQLKMVGLLHLVVLSGINITFLSIMIASLTSNFSKRVSILITILTIILFIIFVGPQAPIIRAAIMSILTLVAIILKKRAFSLYGLFLSAAIVLAVYPQWFKTTSFQLSYAATLGIILLGKVKTQTKVNNKFGALILEVRKAFRVSIAAQAFTLPVVFIYFKQISVIAPLSTLIVSPLVPPLMIFGFLTSVLGKMNYALGLPFSYLCYGLLAFMITVINSLSKIPFIYFQF